MRMSAVVIVLAMAWLGAASPALAQGRDKSDRALRSDLDAIRNEIRQDRLRKPPTPLFPQFWPQAEPVEKEQAKPRRSGQGR